MEWIESEPKEKTQWSKDSTVHSSSLQNAIR